MIRFSSSTSLLRCGGSIHGSRCPLTIKSASISSGTRLGLNPGILHFNRRLHYQFKPIHSLKRGIRLNIRLKSTSSSQEPKKSVWFDIKRLSRLAKPEVALLFGALACLIVTSSVSMSLPLFIGKIIDTARPPSDIGDKTDETKSGNSILSFLGLNQKEDENDKIFGLDPYHFYGSLGILFTIGSLANFGRIYLLRSVGERLVARLRSRLFSKILSQDSYFFDVGPNKAGMKTGDLISRISSDTQIISKSLSGNISDGARALISGCVGLSMMCWVSWKLTLCMSLIFPPLILMSTVYGRRIKQLSRTIQDNLGDMTKVTEEKLNGLKTIQSFAQQTKVVHEYNQEIKKIFNSSMLEGKLSGIYFSGNGFLGNVTMIGLLVIGTNFIGRGDISIGDLSSFMMYAVYTGSSVFGLGNFYTELMKGIGAAERIFELIELKPKITTSLGEKVNDLTEGDIKFSNIRFNYPSRSDTPVFNNLNLGIKKGEHVCIVGPSGSGKSTISQLLLRFYDPISGGVTVNNHDIKDLNLNFYRSLVGYVQQEPLLFSGTIRENITFGVKDASDEEIAYAAKLSNAYDFIMDFPDGFDTYIGPSSTGSAQLSGGQKQRISLARTLIKHPKILVLDEATSALDSHLEEVVMRNLSQLSREKTGEITILLIAHRLSTIKNSERIIVLNNHGEVVEDGYFSVLYSNPDSELNKLLKKQ
ncbi:hypothetical protein HYPBUDRAFT_154030 [Hyphopichia burtonii NRRL Y-1933]|uniref:Uncharacterized protein n=1 Tax=Hyphopichia burtonii NRRL Y-1933 TaxID=984485 RepID=A0A1E4RD44_9ASCO|nr:hypothetical protein HYPBUDRAFT_154030 [Hyphopichia burtonii NRRL Y-1933]ODV65172.1 hypothetical protein HYPBUDRAFT_154030 [Hyphopichia burtonii NRRL Y-1933]